MYLKNMSFEHALMSSNMTSIEKFCNNGSETSYRHPLNTLRSTSSYPEKTQKNDIVISQHVQVTVGKDDSSTGVTHTCPLMSISAYFWRSARTIST